MRVRIEQVNPILAWVDESALVGRMPSPVSTFERLHFLTADGAK